MIKVSVSTFVVISLLTGCMSSGPMTDQQRRDRADDFRALGQRMEAQGRAQQQSAREDALREEANRPRTTNCQRIYNQTTCTTY